MRIHEKNNDLLISEIKKQSDKEIELIRKQTEAEVQKILKNAHQKSEKIRIDLVANAEQKAEALKRKILSGVHLEIKNEKLKNQEKLYRMFIDELHRKLDKFRHSEEYKKILKEWIIKGIMIIDDDYLVLTVGEDEHKFIDNFYLKEIIDRFENDEGKSIKLNLSKDKINDGGVITSDSSGKMSFDNSFSAKLNREKDNIRLLINNKFFKDE